MMLAARVGHDRRMWLACGGRQTLTSYQVRQPDSGHYPEVPQAHWDFLTDALEDYHEIDTHFFVHGCVYPDVPLHEQPTHMLYWEKLFDPGPHCSGKIMVCGHTRQVSGLPLNLGHTVCIDTGAYAEGSFGWLTCLDVLNSRYWQANQKGETRTGELEESEWDPATGE
jgi:serine/threonine protein phosphatase 1